MEIKVLIKIETKKIDDLGPPHLVDAGENAPQHRNRCEFTSGDWRVMSTKIT